MFVFQTFFRTIHGGFCSIKIVLSCSWAFFLGEADMMVEVFYVYFILFHFLTLILWVLYFLWKKILSDYFTLSNVMRLDYQFYNHYWQRIWIFLMRWYLKVKCYQFFSIQNCFWRFAVFIYNQLFPCFQGQYGIHILYICNWCKRPAIIFHFVFL